jgi:hypothetical protein
VADDLKAEQIVFASTRPVVAALAETGGGVDDVNVRVCKAPKQRHSAPRAMSQSQAVAKSGFMTFDFYDMLTQIGQRRP